MSSSRSDHINICMCVSVQKKTVNEFKKDKFYYFLKDLLIKMIICFNFMNWYYSTIWIKNFFQYNIQQNHPLSRIFLSFVVRLRSDFDNPINMVVKYRLNIISYISNQFSG
jgi:hypothetical protein